MRRRTLIASIPAAMLLATGGVARAAGSFQAFLAQVDAQAAARGVSYATRRAALSGLLFPISK